MNQAHKETLFLEGGVHVCSGGVGGWGVRGSKCLRKISPMSPRGPGGCPLLSPHTHSTAFLGPFQLGDWRLLPQVAGMVDMSSVKGQRQEPHTIVNLWHRSQVSPHRADWLCLTVHQTTDCPLPTPVTQTHLLFQSFLPVMPSTWPGGLPWVQVESLLGARKISLVQGLQPGGLGRDQGKVGEMVIRAIWLPENFTAYPGRKHGDEGRILPGRQPAFVCMDGACPHLPFFSPAPCSLTSESPVSHQCQSSPSSGQQSRAAGADLG